MSKYIFLLIISVTAFSLPCIAQKLKSTATPKSASSKEIKLKGILNNKTGLDGCSWVIKLNKKDSHDHEYLEPTNLDKFKLKLVEGKVVEVIYMEENSISACMVGTIVSLKSIKGK